MADLNALIKSGFSRREAKIIAAQLAAGVGGGSGPLATVDLRVLTSALTVGSGGVDRTSILWNYNGDAYSGQTGYTDADLSWFTRGQDVPGNTAADNWTFFLANGWYSLQLSWAMGYPKTGFGTPPNVIQFSFPNFWDAPTSANFDAPLVDYGGTSVATEGVKVLGPTRWADPSTQLNLNMVFWGGAAQAGGLKAYTGTGIGNMNLTITKWS